MSLCSPIPKRGTIMALFFMGFSFSIEALFVNTTFDPELCKAKLHRFVQIASTHFGLELYSDPETAKHVLMELSFLDIKTRKLFVSPKGVEKTETILHPLKRDLLKVMDQRISLQPMINSVTELLCNKMPATTAPIPNFTDLEAPSASTKAFFAPLTKKQGKGLDGKIDLPSFLNEFAVAIFVQDIILSHMMASPQIADFVREFVNAKRHAHFGTDDGMDGVEMFTKIRDGMPADPMARDFKAKKLFSVIPPMEGVSEVRRRDATTWHMAPAFVESKNGALTKMVDEFRRGYRGEGIVRTIILNIKEASVGDKSVNFGNQFAGADLAVTEIVSLEGRAPMHEDYFSTKKFERVSGATLRSAEARKPDNRRIDVVEAKTDEIMEDLLKHSVLVTEHKEDNVFESAFDHLPPNPSIMTNMVKFFFDQDPKKDPKNPTTWLDLYTIWNVTFLLEFIFLRAIPLAILFLPTLLNADNYWIQGRTYSLFLGIHAVCLNYREGLSEVTEHAKSVLGENNKVFGGLLLRKFGLNSTDREAFSDAFGLGVQVLKNDAPWWKRAWREVEEGGFLTFQSLEGKSLGALAPLCKVDQEFRQFIDKDCSSENYVQSKCFSEYTDLKPAAGIEVCEALVLTPGDPLKLDIPYRNQGARLGERESAFSPKGIYHGVKTFVKKVKTFFKAVGAWFKSWW